MKSTIILLTVIAVAAAGLITQIFTEPTGLYTGTACSDSDFRDGTGIQPNIRGTVTLYGKRGRLLEKKVDRCGNGIVEEYFCNPLGTNILSERIACAWGCDPDGSRCGRSPYKR